MRSTAEDGPAQAKVLWPGATQGQAESNSPSANGSNSDKAVVEVDSPFASGRQVIESGLTEDQVIGRELVKLFAELHEAGEVTEEALAYRYLEQFVEEESQTEDQLEKRRWRVPYVIRRLIDTDRVFRELRPFENLEPPRAPRARDAPAFRWRGDGCP